MDTHKHRSQEKLSNNKSIKLLVNLKLEKTF